MKFCSKCGELLRHVAGVRLLEHFQQEHRLSKQDALVTINLVYQRLKEKLDTITR